ncbi:YceG family protein [Desulfosporosinus sp. PR]|uniref:YceG family protein n=1 Tax=Candidatus Desulfosporosinus nitrosoreducens TaxID=3401928 RepID=UPI0027E6826D|nr:YceG family protein [Desulfosporosinus sp. PR]MDQ7092416.1 YceG family protein [Desulfosporosinus sp. PR]
METNRNDGRQLQQTATIFKELLSPLNERGKESAHYFYRILGCYEDQNKFLTEIIGFQEKLRSLNNYIFFDMAIPLANDPILIEKTKKILESVALKDYNNGVLLSILEEKGYFSLTPDPSVQQNIREAFGIVLNLYMLNDPPGNISISLNFVTKILLWFSVYGRQSLERNLYNPKIFYWGSPKTHEIYFLILLSLLDCDVLVVNTTFDDRFKKVDQQNKFSLPMTMAKERPLSAFPAKKADKEPRPADKPSFHAPTPVVKESLNLSSLENSDPSIVVKLKQTEAPFEELLVPMHKRSGYISGSFPIIPALFVRCLGVPVSTDDWEAEYYNTLYNLDRTLQISGHYLKFQEGIPVPSPIEIASIPQQFNQQVFQNREEILVHILRANLLPQTKNLLLDNTIKQSFIDTVNLFSQKQSNLSFTILLNFSLKLVIWINRYLPKLLENKDSREKELNQDCQFRVLFYGSIKPHEIYLLNFFYKIGSDVLFIHSELEGDLPFRSFDEDNILTQVLRNPRSLPLAPFPVSERLIRKSTVAYNASKEIEEVIYSEDVGLYKPWQFESYLTQPITLKTTYDELKILWQEPSKIRPEFKVQNKTVYIPNLFAKINGVNEDLGAYWQDLKAFSTAPNTRLIEFVPFSRVSYTRQELYQADYLLNGQGYVDELKVMKSQYYKFGYLRTPLQHFLLTKLNELIASKMFLFEIDEKMKLTILMTILTMEDSLIKLIENFDFPQEIPKIIVYDRNKESFSDIDAILLAYFNLVGLDILIFTPTKYNTLEQWLKPSLFDVHQLPLVKYELDLSPLYSLISSSAKKTGLLARLFGGR